MAAAYFYIEYRNGTCTQVEFKTQTAAKKAYDQYGRAPEDAAKGWGWEIKVDPPTLSQQLRARRAHARTGLVIPQ
jgi:hypothetical protein